MNKFITKAVILINLLVGLFLWFLFSTDYSLIGNLPDMLFPPLSAFVALASIAFVKTYIKECGFLITLVHLPSLIGGGLYILIALVLLVPPFTLGAIFTASEIANEIEIQRALSPDGSRTAYVYFRGVGAYSGGSGVFLYESGTETFHYWKGIFFIAVFLTLMKILLITSSGVGIIRFIFQKSNQKYR